MPKRKKSIVLIILYIFIFVSISSVFASETDNNTHIDETDLNEEPKICDSPTNDVISKNGFYNRNTIHDLNKDLENLKTGDKINPDKGSIFNHATDAGNKIKLGSTLNTMPSTFENNETESEVSKFHYDNECQTIENDMDIAGNSFIEINSDNTLKTALLSKTNNDEILGSCADEDLLGAGNTYSTLAALIIAGANAHYISLTTDYIFDKEKDQSFARGIDIVGYRTGRTVFDGNGHSIDARNEAAIFNVISSTVSFRNMAFLNAGFSLNMMDCYKLTAPPGGGAIDKNFNAVRILDSDVEFLNCKFINNNCPVYGAVTLADTSIATIKNCEFFSNSAQYGGAIKSDSSCTLRIERTKFEENRALKHGDGGAIYVGQSRGPVPELTITDCTFNRNTASSSGGAIQADTYGKLNVIITGCSFSDNVAKYNGGAISTSTNAQLKDCNFTNNQADECGGVYMNNVYIDSKDIDVETMMIYRCRFVENTAKNLATDLYIEYEMVDNVFTVEENYFKNNNIKIPSIYIKNKELMEKTWNFTYNSFVPMDYEIEYTFMKFENTRNTFRYNWWGRNNPYERWMFGIETDGLLESKVDRRYLVIELYPAELLTGQTQFDFKVSNMKRHVLQPPIDYFPYGVSRNCYSNSGNVRFGGTYDNPNVQYTPTIKGDVGFIVTIDHQTLTYNANIPKETWKKIVWGIAGAALATCVVLGIIKIINKNSDKPDTVSNDTDNNTQYTYTIEEAINNASDNYAIVIPPGIYRGAGNVGLTINKNLIIMSDPEKSGDVIIDGEGSSWIWNITATNVTILGLTFINAKTDGNGGALNFNNNMENCTIMGKFINNQASGNGGAIYFKQKGGNVTYSEFTSNSATNGGAIYYGNGGKIENSTFSYNQATTGGAIFAIGNLITNSNVTFKSNIANDEPNIKILEKFDINSIDTLTANTNKNPFLRNNNVLSSNLEISDVTSTSDSSSTISNILKLEVLHMESEILNNRILTRNQNEEEILKENNEVKCFSYLYNEINQNQIKKLKVGEKVKYLEIL